MAQLTCSCNTARWTTERVTSITRKPSFPRLNARPRKSTGVRHQVIMLHCQHRQSESRVSTCVPGCHPRLKATAEIACAVATPGSTSRTNHAAAALRIPGRFSDTSVQHKRCRHHLLSSLPRQAAAVSLPTKRYGCSHTQSASHAPADLYGCLRMGPLAAVRLRVCA